MSSISILRPTEKEPVPWPKLIRVRAAPPLYTTLALEHAVFGQIGRQDVERHQYACAKQVPSLLGLSIAKSL